MNILIIGGTNFIGPAVICHLINMGHQVTVFHRGKTASELPESINHIFGDRSNLSDFKSEFENLSPDVVLDGIAYTEEDAVETMNTFKGIAGRIVVISSIDVYRAYGVILGQESESDLEPVPLTEDSPLRTSYYPFQNLPNRPLNVPAEYEKILVEKVVMSEPELPGTIVRLPMVYGCNDPLNRLFPYLQRIDENRPFIVLEESIANWYGSYGYVENIAYAIALAITNEKAKNRIYHVAEEKTLSESERVERLGKIAGWEGKVMAVSKDKLPTDWSLPVNAEQNWFVDSTRIRKELGYIEIFSQDEALQKSIEWQKKYPPQNPENCVIPWLLDYNTEDKILRGYGN